MEKKYLDEADKIELLEKNNVFMARQLEAMSIKDRFMDLNNNILPKLQSDLEEYTKKLLKKYECEGGSIGPDYSIIQKV